MDKGTWVDRKNKEEAQKVVDLIDKILKERKENETVGIITFNIQQKDLIDDMLEERAMKDESFANLYNAEVNRTDGNEDVSLFVKNIENVQGDERDIIIFSTAYAKNEKGRISVNFGSLSAEGGENRLNVAVSRARSIYDKLKELGYEVDLGVGVSGYRLDLAIYDSKAGRF